jgi:hypothetical protein
VIGISSAVTSDMTPPESSDWDVVDQASLESFPASDPPAWGSHHAVASEILTDETPGDAPPPRRRARFMRGMIAMGMALGGLILLAMRVRRRTHWR